VVLLRELVQRDDPTTGHWRRRLEFYDCYPEFLGDLAPAVAEHKLHYSTHLIEGGLETIPVTFPEMFTGRVAGKMIAKIG
jgi:NADPH-dependent curcumin reductase